MMNLLLGCLILEESPTDSNLEMQEILFSAEYKTGKENVEIQCMCVMKESTAGRTIDNVGPVFINDLRVHFLYYNIDFENLIFMRI